MDEFKFVLKCFVFTMALVVLSQMKVGSGTVESISMRWLQKSNVALYIQSAAAGGAMTLRNAGHSLKQSIVGTLDSSREPSIEKATR